MHALWQKAKNHNVASFCQNDDICFCSTPMGKHKLDSLLKEMYRKAGVATIYTAHCIRATSVTVLNAAGLEKNRVKCVTSHSSDKSIESCNTLPTTEQQFESSTIVSRFIAKQNPIQFSVSCRSTYFGTFSNLDSAAKSTPYCSFQG